jgi:membrane fusion protein (multidrug efflux system)
MVEQARAALDSDAASLKLAEADRNCFANLARDGSGTLQAQQQAEAHWMIQQAACERDLAGERSTEHQIAIMQADLAKAHADLLVAQAKNADAELNLSYAQIMAPISGVVVQRRARVGGYVHVGEPLLMLVPMDAIYIEANFRETQLARVRVGQPVTITADALPDIGLKGRVESLGPASGVSFSPVPPHNATDNFAKIVQRLLVRIQLNPNQPYARQLRVGMSVHPSIGVGDSLVATQPRAKQSTSRATAPL